MTDQESSNSVSASTPKDAPRVVDRRFWVENDTEPSDSTGSAVKPPRYVETLEEAARKSEERLKEYIHQFKLHQRETDQIRQRLERDVDRRVELRIADLFREFLEIVDSLERAVLNLPSEFQSQPLAHGVQLAFQQMLRFLETQGVKRISVIGSKFDPKLAEAVDTTPTQDPGLDDFVSEEYACGYMYRETLLRPSRVRVFRLNP